MNQFKPGDKVKGKYIELTGTVKAVLSNDLVHLVLDPGLQCTGTFANGRQESVTEGTVPAEYLQLISESDWKSLWEDNN